MITNNDLKAIKLSPTKKDFYQNWNELLDTAKKLSERWDPTSTNESDPGIVLLKVLTAVADKLNYTVDKNILEAFMPTAAQEESMRKLCDMMGYNIKYYQSATTRIVFAYTNTAPLPDRGLSIPQFTTITNADQDINFVTIEPGTLTNDAPRQEILCMEGQLVQCESENDNIISMNQLNDLYRYYLPETQIAENGIFIYNVNDGNLSERWTKVENLNIQKAGSLVYKFGFDSRLGRPYIQFTEDIAQIIEDGLLIYYLRTSGINGNISARTLTTFELPTIDEWEDTELTVNDFTIINYNAATNGRNIETITQAYNNFKKTIGTFDTLVTCRDYMNKIYQLTSDDNIPVVSNIIVSDIRDDINRSNILCSFNDYGICYKEQAITQNGEKLIDHFDLMLYPFKTVYGINDEKEFLSSFTYTSEPLTEIKAKLENLKTISHVFKSPSADDVVCIKNYLKLNAKITTTYKVNTPEEAIILDNIKTALYTAFNMRQLDFGEEIPFDSILATIENADTRIKNVALEEPILYTKFCTVSNPEGYSIDELAGAKIYDKLALRNILAGRIQLFDYDNNFKYNFSETNYPSGKREWSDPTTVTYDTIYPNNNLAKLNSLTSSLDIIFPADSSTNNTIELKTNEVIKLRAPKLTTTTTYPAYVHYYLHLTDRTEEERQAIPGSFITLKTFMSSRWQFFTDYLNNKYTAAQIIEFLVEQEIPDESFQAAIERYGALFSFTEDTDDQQLYIVTAPLSSKRYYYFNIGVNTYQILNSFIKNQTFTSGGQTLHYAGIFAVISKKSTNIIGHDVDVNLWKYKLYEIWPSIEAPLTNLYIQNIAKIDPVHGNPDGRGCDAIVAGIEKNTSYQLLPGEYLLINYTQSTSTDSLSSETSVIHNEIYKQGDIIQPNFLLKDSLKVFNSTSQGWTKTTGYDFGDYELQGMFTLGTNEQIEIKKVAKTKLTDKFTYLYWIFNDKTMRISSTENNHYILQDGEYIFCTDGSKLDMAYWGAGTQIDLTGLIELAPLSEAEQDISLDDILTNGINAIPWKIKNLNETDTFIELVEYQYIVLADGSEIALTANNLITTVPGATNKIINGEWQALSLTTPVKYYIDGKEATLPALNIDNYSWQIKSSLNFNISQTTIQTLSRRVVADRVTVIEKIALKFDSIAGEPVNDVILQPLYVSSGSGTGEFIPLSLKTNWLCQATTDKVTVAVKVNNVNISTAELKVFRNNDIGIAQSAYNSQPTTINTPVAFNNLSTLWTSIPTKSWTVDQAHPENSDSLALYINVPNTNAFGLMLIYVKTENEVITNNAYIHPLGISPVIYNYNEDGQDAPQNDAYNHWTWWKNGKVGDKYYLRSGINIVRFNHSGCIKIYAGSAKDNVLIFSDLAIIKTSESNPFGFNNTLINYKANYSTEIYSAAACLAFDLAKADPNNDFYYNCPLDNSTAIDFNNELLSTSEIVDTLASPRIWYDYNNVNNKFVISEIDVDYLNKNNGIRIAKSSKL